MEYKMDLCEKFLKSLDSGHTVSCIHVKTSKDGGISFNHSGEIPVSYNTLQVIQKILEAEARDIIEETNKKLDDINPQINY